MGALPITVYCRIRPPPTPGARQSASAPLYSVGESFLGRYHAALTPVLQIAPFQSDERIDDPVRGRHHPPEAPGEALRPSIAAPPTPSLLDQRHFQFVLSLYLCRAVAGKLAQNWGQNPISRLSNYSRWTGFVCFFGPENLPPFFSRSNTSHTY